MLGENQEIKQARVNARNARLEGLKAKTTWSIADIQTFYVMGFNDVRNALIEAKIEPVARNQYSVDAIKQALGSLPKSI